MEKLDISKVEKVYSGKAHTCACGCSGKYYYNSQHAIATTEYEFAISDKMCRKVLKIVMANEAEFPEETSFRSCTIGNRSYVVYWK